MARRTKWVYNIISRTIDGGTERFTNKILQTDSYFDMILEYGDIPNVQKYEFADYFDEDINNIKTIFKGNFIVIKGKYVTSIVYPNITARRRITKNVEKAFKLLIRHEASDILDRVDTHPAVIGE